LTFDVKYPNHRIMIRDNSSQRKRLIRSLVNNAEIMIQAGISRTNRTCGKPSCACHVDVSRRHGPNSYLTFRSAEGKSSGLYVPPEHLEEAVVAKKAWDEFWDAATALAASNREELKRCWQAAGKARAKR
jgi:hypothetical protein